MSKQLNKSDILYLQRVCAVCGIYNGPLDGKWSSTVADSEVVLDQRRLSIREKLGTFDPRSEKNISTLIPPAQEAARRFMQVASGSALNVRIISGSRTYAEQDALYAIGRTVQTNRSPVTKAKGGRSNHNFGLAWDVGIFDASGRYMDGKKKGDDDAYRALWKAVQAKIDNIEWGGNWKTFVDLPHFQLATGGKNTAEVRKLFEAGKPMFA